MAALTSAIVMSDIWYLRSDRIVKHIFLGGIITALFYALCGRGYEIVNWIVIGLITLFMVIMPLMEIASGGPASTQPVVRQKGCNKCGDVPASSCSCVPPPKSSPSCDTESECKSSDKSYKKYSETHSGPMPDPTPEAKD